MNLTVALGSLLGILALALAAKLLGLGGGALDEASAMAEAEAQLPGFEAATAKIEGGHATVEGTDGRKLRLRPLGARWVAE